MELGPRRSQEVRESPELQNGGLRALLLDGRVLDTSGRVLGTAFCSPALTLSEKLCPVSGQRVWSYKTQATRATRDVTTRSGVGELAALSGFG